MWFLAGCLCRISAGISIFFPCTFFCLLYFKTAMAEWVSDIFTHTPNEAKGIFFLPQYDEIIPLFLLGESHKLHRVCLKAQNNSHPKARPQSSNPIQPLSPNTNWPRPYRPSPHKKRGPTNRPTDRPTAQAFILCSPNNLKKFPTRQNFEYPSIQRQTD